MMQINLQFYIWKGLSKENHRYLVEWAVKQKGAKEKDPSCTFSRAQLWVCCFCDVGSETTETPACFYAALIVSRVTAAVLAISPCCNTSRWLR